MCAEFLTKLKVSGVFLYSERANDDYWIMLRDIKFNL